MLDENFERYLDEYIELVTNVTGEGDFRVKHRKKILREWIEHEVHREGDKSLFENPNIKDKLFRHKLI